MDATYYVGEVLRRHPQFKAPLQGVTYASIGPIRVALNPLDFDLHPIRLARAAAPGLDNGTSRLTARARVQITRPLAVRTSHSRG